MATTERAETEVRPFRYEVRQEQMDDLRRRIEATRSPSPGSSRIAPRAFS